MNFRRTLALAAFLFVNAIPASATVLTFTNRADFLAALGSNYSIEDFGSVAQGDAGTSQLTFSNATTGFDVETDSLLWGITLGGNPSISTDDQTAYLLVSNFSTPIYAIGGYFFFDDNQSGIASASAGSVTVDNGVDPLALGNIPSPGSPTYFFGVISDAPILSLRFENNGTDGFVNVDDLIVSAAAVPEPGTYGTLAVASLAGGFAALRTRRK